MIHILLCNKKKNEQYCVIDRIDIDNIYIFVNNSILQYQNSKQLVL